MDDKPLSVYLRQKLEAAALARSVDLACSITSRWFWTKYICIVIGQLHDYVGATERGLLYVSQEYAILSPLGGLSIRCLRLNQGGIWGSRCISRSATASGLRWLTEIVMTTHEYPLFCQRHLQNADPFLLRATVKAGVPC